MEFFKRQVFAALSQAKTGLLSIIDESGTQRNFGSAATKGELAATVKIQDGRIYRLLAIHEDVGLGEGYIRGYWSSDNVTVFLRWLTRNAKCFAARTSLAGHVGKAVGSRLDRFNHWRNRNTREGSRRNISAHYDLGNQFYEAFLDDTMTYSSGYFPGPEDTLSQAQIEKFDRLCRKLSLDADDHLLEIGCGWGGFAVYAAENYGCRITATTISEQQYDYAKQRLRRRGLSNRVEVILDDYRDLRGTYSKIASIEMLEAVGQEYLKPYFAQIDNLLAPHGVAAVQVITCPNPLYKSYCKDRDYIRSHIFPGAHLPSLAALVEASQEAGLDTMHAESFGLHYARTLAEWRGRFDENWEKIKGMGFDEGFRRRWRFYLCYCEAGFLERHINVAQITFARPDELGFSYELHDANPIRLATNHNSPARDSA